MEPESQQNEKDEEIFCMDEENEENIDFVNNGGNNKEDDEFDNIVGVLQEIVLDNKFEQLQSDFFQKNCEIFEDVEENKMIYMEIFKIYQSIIEEFINTELQKRIKDFEMKRFLELLADRKNEIDEQLLEMLFSLTEFQIFKEIMLTEKKRIEKEKQKKQLESVKKKLPQKPLKQSSNNNTNIFSIDKKDMIFKEEHKTNIKNNEKTEKSNKINENRIKKEKSEQFDNKSKEELMIGDLSLDIISLTPQIMKKKGNK